MQSKSTITVARVEFKFYPLATHVEQTKRLLCFHKQN